jgi:hypothetical protein
MSEELMPVWLLGTRLLAVFFAVMANYFMGKGPAWKALLEIGVTAFWWTAGDLIAKRRAE